MDKRRRIFTQQELNLIRELYVEEGEGVAHIAKKLKASHMRINKSLDELGVEKHYVGYTKPKERLVTKSPLYQLWLGIKQRCFNPNVLNYHNYGGRGITMYEPWVNNFPLFEEYILANLGKKSKGYSIDRIEVDGNYEPGNLRWASRPIQNQNQTTTVLNEELVRYIRAQRDSGAKCSDVAKELNLKFQTVWGAWSNKSWKNIN